MQYLLLILNMNLLIVHVDTPSGEREREEGGEVERGEGVMEVDRNMMFFFSFKCSRDPHQPILCTVSNNAYSHYNYPSLVFIKVVKEM